METEWIESSVQSPGVRSINSAQKSVGTVAVSRGFHWYRILPTNLMGLNFGP